MAPTAVRADALATGVFVLGPQKGMNLIESDPVLEGIIVDDDLKIHISTGLKEKVTLSPISKSD